MRDSDFIRLGIEAARIEVRGGDCTQLLADELHRMLDVGVGIGRWPLADPSLGTLTVGGVPAFSSAEFAGVISHMGRHPTIRPDLLADPTPFRLSDHIRLPAFWTTDVWWYVHGQRDGRYPAGFSLGLHDGMAGMVGLHRTTRDFTGEELAYLDLMREPLQTALAFRASLDRSVRKLQAVERTEPVDDRRLTGREWDVLALVATGRTNAMIGGLLGVTERTVRKHLTNTYAKLELPGRTAAAMWHRSATDAPADR